MTRDRWAEWILHRRFGGDPQAAETSLRRLREVRDRVLERAELREGESLLDVGCGDGLIAFGALERGAARVIFSDVSKDLLAVSGELADGDGRAEFLQAAAEDLSAIPDHSIDVVTTRSVIIYVSEKRRAFAEFFRVLRPRGRLSMFEPINSFGHDERQTGFFGIEMGAQAPIAKRLQGRYRALAGDESAMMDFDERTLLELAREAGFEHADVVLEARIERGRLWGSEPPPLEQLLSTAPNPNAPTFQEVLDAELTPDEQAAFLTYLRPRYEAGEMTDRSAVAYLRARKDNTSTTLR